MDQVDDMALATSLEGVDQHFRGVDAETGQIDHGVRIEAGYSRPERPVGFFRLPVGLDDVNLRPRRMRMIGLPDASAERHDIVAGFDKARNKIASDMAGSADNSNPHGSSLLLNRIMATACP
jgi:hypothetical protein